MNQSSAVASEPMAIQSAIARQDPLLKRLSSRIGPLAAPSSQTRSSPAAIRYSPIVPLSLVISGQTSAFPLHCR